MQVSRKTIISCQKLSKVSFKFTLFLQPPPPLVKVLSSNKMANQSGHGDSTLENSKRSGGSGASRQHSARARGKENRDSTLSSRSQVRTQQNCVTSTCIFKWIYLNPYFHTQELPEGLSMSRLQNILKQYGEYPAKYRSADSAHQRDQVQQRRP